MHNGVPFILVQYAYLHFHLNGPVEKVCLKSYHTQVLTIVISTFVLTKSLTIETIWKARWETITSMFDEARLFFSCQEDLFTRWICRLGSVSFSATHKCV